MLYTSNIVLKASSEIFGANTIWKSLKDKVFFKAFDERPVGRKGQRGSKYLVKCLNYALIV